MMTTEMTVVSRQPLDGIVAAYSSARLERVELADGRRVIFKTLPARGDWLTRVSGGTDRSRRLWESGLLARMGSVVDHTTIDVLEIDGHDVVVMRDATADLFRPETPVSRRDSRRVLAGLGALHRVGRDEPMQALCPIGARYGMFAPTVHANDPGPGVHPIGPRIVAGWERFAERTDADVAAAVYAVHRDPDLLGRRLATRPPTLLHGDTKLENLGLGPARLVAVDWGDLTGFGPPEIDVAWYALQNTGRIGGSPDDVFADYEAIAGRPLDPEALDLACIGSLAQLGFRMAGFAVEGRSEARRAAAAAELVWWTRRVRVALDRVALL